MRLVLPYCLALTASACSVETGPAAEERAWVLDAVAFPGVSDGVAPGFDLDGRVSGDADGAGCFHADLVDPQGVEGVDNQLAVLSTDLEGLVGDAIDGLVAGAIRDGQLLLVVRVRGVDDPLDDDAVEVTVTRAMGRPLVGTDGRLLAEQTLELHATADERWIGGAIRDGVVETEAAEIVLRVEILATRFDLVLHDARVRLDPAAESGLLGGGTPIADLVALIESTDEETLKSVAPDILAYAADLRPGTDGACADLSVGLTFEPTPVFLWE